MKKGIKKQTSSPSVQGNEQKKEKCVWMDGKKIKTCTFHPELCHSCKWK